MAGLAADGVGMSESAGVSASGESVQHAHGTTSLEGAGVDTSLGTPGTNTPVSLAEVQRGNKEPSADGGEIMELVDPTSNHAYYLDTKTRRTSWVRSELLVPASTAERSPAPAPAPAPAQAPAQSPAQAPEQVPAHAPTQTQESAQVQEHAEMARAEWYRAQQARLDAAVLDGAVRSYSRPGIAASDSQAVAASSSEVDTVIEERVEASSGRHYFVHVASGRSAWTEAELATEGTRISNATSSSATATTSATPAAPAAAEAVEAAHVDTSAGTASGASNMPEKQQAAKHEIFDWDERSSFIRRVLSIRVERVRIAQEESAAAAVAGTRSQVLVQKQPQPGAATAAVADSARSTAAGTADDGGIESHFDPRTGRRYYFDKRSRRSR